MYFFYKNNIHKVWRKTDMITSFIAPFYRIAAVFWQREYTVLLHLCSHLNQDKKYASETYLLISHLPCWLVGSLLQSS